jgi:hypothetical protein
MIKYDLLVYLGVGLLLAAFIVAAYISRSTPVDVDPEIRRMRVAGGMLIMLADLFIFATILYFVDPDGAGKEIFDKSFTPILALLGTISGYIFGAGKK